jgi:uncharacterized membrane protein YfhO
VLLPAGDAAPEGAGSGYRPATVTASRPTRVDVRATLDVPGTLVLSSVWHPGWRVEVDGRPAPVLRANGAFCAVGLAAGDHEVVFRFVPAPLYAGCAVALLAAVAAVAQGFGLRSVRAWRTGKGDRA